MRVAVFGRFRFKSANGVDRTVEGHLRQLVRREHHVTLVTYEKPSVEAEQVLSELGVSVVVMPSNFLLSCIACIGLRGSYDLVCMHSVFTYRNWVVPLFLECPWIVTPNGGYSPGQLAFKRPRLKKLALFLFEKRLLNKALAVHVLSKAEAKQVIEVAPSAVVVMAPNGCDVATRDAMPLAPFNGEARFLFVGRVAWMHKGLDLLVNGLLKIPEELAWRLDVVGPYFQGQKDYLIGCLGGSYAGRRVFFHGAVYGDDRDKFLDECHIFVHTSRWEGMPFAVVEALLAGRPVIVTEGTNMADMVIKYNAGWVVSGNDVEAALLSAISTSWDEIRRKGLNARKLAAEELNWNSIGAHLFGEIENKLFKLNGIC